MAWVWVCTGTAVIFRSWLRPLRATLFLLPATLTASYCRMRIEFERANVGRMAFPSVSPILFFSSASFWIIIKIYLLSHFRFLGSPEHIHRYIYIYVYTRAVCLIFTTNFVERPFFSSQHSFSLICAYVIVVLTEWLLLPVSRGQFRWPVTPWTIKTFYPKE